MKQRKKKPIYPSTQFCSFKMLGSFASVLPFLKFANVLQIPTYHVILLLDASVYVSKIHIYIFF